LYTPTAIPWSRGLDLPWASYFQVTDAIDVFRMLLLCDVDHAVFSMFSAHEGVGDWHLGALRIPGMAWIRDLVGSWGGASGSPSWTAGFQVDYLHTDVNGVEFYNSFSAHNGYGPHVVRVLRPARPTTDVPHNFLYVLPVEAGLGSEFGDGLEIVRMLGLQDRYNLTIIAPSFHINPWYADNPRDPHFRYETFMAEDLRPWVMQTQAVTGNEENWLLGFSKSGLGAQYLILKHPGSFSLAASWDFPANMSRHRKFGSDSAASYGTDANFQANYRLTAAFLEARKAPFLNTNRIWVGGYSVFGSDISDYDKLLTLVGIAHTTGTPQHMAHTWDGGWVPVALAALHRASSGCPPPAA
jgi:hypothetical protein